MEAFQQSSYFVLLSCVSTHYARSFSSSPDCVHRIGVMRCIHTKDSWEFGIATKVDTLMIRIAAVVSALTTIPSTYVSDTKFPFVFASRCLSYDIEVFLPTLLLYIGIWDESSSVILAHSSDSSLQSSYARPMTIFSHRDDKDWYSKEFSIQTIFDARTLINWWLTV